MNPMLYYTALLPSMLAAITFHEYAHARVALHFGDPTAKLLGRVSLNPLAHLDPLGTLGFLLVGFGWGKPVPVDRSRLRFPRADFFVSAAGPFTNFVLAFLAAQLFRTPALWDWLGAKGWAGQAQLLAAMFLNINLALGLFNLLPLFPLDGAHVVENLLPGAVAPRFERLNRSYGPILLMILIAGGMILPVSPIHLLIGPPLQFLKDLFLLGAQ
jgi:Zn-dependent protease